MLTRVRQAIQGQRTLKQVLPGASELVNVPTGLLWAAQRYMPRAAGRARPLSAGPHPAVGLQAWHVHSACLDPAVAASRPGTSTLLARFWRPRVAQAGHIHSPRPERAVPGSAPPGGGKCVRSVNA
jgi:hypothetical protein